MISSPLQRVIVRTLLGLLAERGISSIEEADLVGALINAKIVTEPEECRHAITSLKYADVVQNGRGTKINLSGTGLTLGATVALPPEVSAAIEASIDELLGKVVPLDAR